MTLRFSSQYYLLGFIVVIIQFVLRAEAAPRHATIVSRDLINATTKYDFIIAGGGIAGLTLADRLTEVPEVAVLVVEAGPLDHGEDAVLVPGAYNPAPYFWPMVSVPQTALNNTVHLATCARVVGGGSTINAMIFLRGDVEDYNGWTKLSNEGWSWDSLLPYFKKSENFTAPDPAFAAAGNISWIDSVHGFGGPVQNTYPNYFFPGSGNWWVAANSSGVNPCPDPNAGDVKGIFWLRLSEDAEKRHRNHARINHYERVISSRPNYHLLPDTTVRRVLFEGNKTTGVELMPTTGGDLTVMSASKEVILAAGGLHTPQILQLSGVGPEPLLNSFGINVVSDLPGVGQNFQDQPTITMSYNFTDNSEPNWNTLLGNATYDAEQFALYNSTGRGPYTITRTLSTNFISLPLQNLTSKANDIIENARSLSGQGSSLPPDTDPTVIAGYMRQREIMLDQLDNKVSIGGLHWGTANTGTLYLFKPFSRGTVTINSTDPLANPLVDFRAATDPTDLDVAVALVRKAREIMDAPSMRVLGPIEVAPFGQVVQTDEEIREAVRQTFNPSNGHECCTAAMMPKELGGVVDDKLRVYGIDGLRVADTSFWPMPLNGAPSATVYASAEKLADMVKDEYYSE
ncbi:hypothetical protein KVR01_006859 [Diaporthe batatas]|uniref:uncharacterized protein n=1 Tax=Diaporthe batatas TaxID=748121 RepID=UPI001D05965B|nr:uncharacterized protein KVR01_006859 [Diaporthe batatas]KAG8163562.1 hypothetical protein KVR01_006859 [Diaporthe batatas]